MSRTAWSRTAAADFIESHRDEILRSWETRVRSEVSASKEQAKVALQNSLGEFLDAIALSIRMGHPKTAQDASHVHHGKQRSAALAYSLPQVIREYGILRQTLFDALEADGDLPLDIRETILVSIESAMCEAATAFADDKQLHEATGRMAAEGERDRMSLAARLLRSELQTVQNVSREKVAELSADADRKDKFVATLAHDLRSPLGSIQMAYELLLRELPKRPEVATLSDLMERNLLRADAMLRDLLDTHRIRAGQPLPMSIASCNLSSVAEETLKDLRFEFGDRFSLRSDREVSGFWDSGRLRRLLVNLLMNAVKYGDSDRVVTITLSQDAHQTTLAVHNFGAPIAAEAQKSLFEAFYRSHGDGTNRVDGWGLGLSLVQGVARGHGGRVEVDSDTERGTTFTVTLPDDARTYATA